MTSIQRVFLILLALARFNAQPTNVTAVEIGKDNTDLLPHGKEADGIIGDFVLRNDRIHALISGAQPLRRANMRTENAFVTQGCLYDLDLAGENNDQITAFRPGNAGGEVSWVRVVEGSAPGGIIESVRTAAKGSGLYTRHEYRLEPGWQHLLITSTYRNESAKPVTIRPPAEWRGFEDSREWPQAKFALPTARIPSTKRAYAWAFLPSDRFNPKWCWRPERHGPSASFWPLQARRSTLTASSRTYFSVADGDPANGVSGREVLWNQAEDFLVFASLGQNERRIPAQAALGAPGA